MLTQADVEDELVRLSDRLEESTHELAKHMQAYAQAEVNFKRAFAQTFVKAEGAMDLREQIAVLETADERMAWRSAEALKDSTQELCRTYRNQIDALRTIGANVRAQT